MRHLARTSIVESSGFLLRSATAFRANSGPFLAGCPGFGRWDWGRSDSSVPSWRMTHLQSVGLETRQWPQAFLIGQPDSTALRTAWSRASLPSGRRPPRGSFAMVFAQLSSLFP